MDAKEIIARRVAQEVKPNTLVNLGIGLPSLVAHYLPKEVHVFFQAENGVIGLGPRPPEGMEDPDLTDAGGGFVTAMPGAASIDSAMSFGLIRGGHLDMTVLGGLEVDERGYLANWMVPGKMVPGMGGAMDLVSGARKVVVAMVHTGKGGHKIVPRCTLPLTATRRVSLIVTELAVIEPTDAGLCLRERGPGVSTREIENATGAYLIVEGDPPEMALNGGARWKALFSLGTMARYGGAGVPLSRRDFSAVRAANQSRHRSLADQNAALLLRSPDAQPVAIKLKISNLIGALVKFVPRPVDSCDELIPVEPELAGIGCHGGQKRRRLRLVGRRASVRP